MRTALVTLAAALPLAAAAGPDVAPPPRRIDARFAPYAPDPDHPWNRLHRALFVRETRAGGRRAHTTDPLLYRGGSFLFAGDSHRQAVALLDGFDPAGDPVRRLALQRDLWAAFDYAAWEPDGWVLKARFEPGAVALRNRLAKVIGRLALSDRELAALPDNYALAAKAGEYPADHDPQRPGRPFLPADLFDPAGPWVRFHRTSAEPMAERHFEGAGGRAAHVVFLRLPGGRAATEAYLKGLRPGEPLADDPRRHAVQQFPAGTAVAMVRRALAVDAAGAVRVTPLAELVQVRVYRRIPDRPGGDGGQDVCEFVLDRAALFAGGHGLRAVGPDEPAEPSFGRHEGDDPFERNHPLAPSGPQLKTCAGCHAEPGVRSVLSMARAFRADPADRGEPFRTYAWEVEAKYTVRAKGARFDWGLLKGKLEAK